MPQLQEHHDDFIFQQDGALSHYLQDVREYLNAELPRHCFLMSFRRWCSSVAMAPTLTELNTMQLFLWDYAKILCTHFAAWFSRTACMDHTHCQYRGSCYVGGEYGKNRIIDLMFAVWPRVRTLNTCKVSNKT